MGLSSYQLYELYNELFSADGSFRPATTTLLDRVASSSIEQLQHHQQMAQLALLKMGVTFNYYADNQSTEKILPFDTVPRIVLIGEWKWLERGLKQRIEALNLFLGIFQYNIF